MVSKVDVEEEYPGTVRTYFRLRTGQYTGGNAMIANPALVPRIRDLGQQLFDDRKNAAAMVKAAGVGFVIKFALGRLQPEDLADKIRELLGGSGAAVTTEHSSLAVDVDKPSDLALVERVLSERR
jgi:hypothetical protein